MEQKLGTVFRKIRESKNISMRQAAGIILSKSQLSRFERDENEISANKLFALLENLSVSVTEYAQTLNNYTLDYATQFFNQLGQAEELGDFKRIEQLKSESQLLFEETLQLRYRLLSLAAKSILSSHNLGEEFTAFERQMITSYLYDVLEWGQFELKIFIGTLMQLEIYEVIEFVDDLLDKTEFYKAIPENQNLVMMALRNSAIFFMRTPDFDRVEKIIEKFDAIGGQRITKNITKKQLQIELYEAKKEYKKAAHELIDLLEVYEKYGDPYYTRIYKKELTELLKK